MKVLLPCLLFLSIIFGLMAGKENYENAHASFISTSKRVLQDYQRQQARLAEERTIKRMGNLLRRYGSPMAGTEREIYYIAKANGIDPRILLGISNAESSLGTRPTCGAFNVYSWNCTDSGNRYSFTSYQEATRVVAQALDTDPNYKEFQASHQIFDITIRYLTGNKVRWINNVQKIISELEES